MTPHSESTESTPMPSTAVVTTGPDLTTANPPDTRRHKAERALAQLPANPELTISRLEAREALGQHLAEVGTCIELTLAMEGASLLRRNIDICQQMIENKKTSEKMKIRCISQVADMTEKLAFVLRETMAMRRDLARTHPQAHAHGLQSAANSSPHSHLPPDLTNLTVHVYGGRREDAQAQTQAVDVPSEKVG